MEGTPSLICHLLYGTGMRVLEGLRLRVKDIEFERREIVVREGKGNKDRVTVLPENLITPLKAQLQKCVRCTKKMCWQVLAGCICPMRWR